MCLLRRLPGNKPASQLAFLPSIKFACTHTLTWQAHAAIRLYNLLTVPSWLLSEAKVLDRSVSARAHTRTHTDSVLRVQLTHAGAAAVLLSQHPDQAV